MGDADFFLGSSFKWNRHPDGSLSVHVSHKAFCEHTASRLGLKDCNRVPLMTTYRSGWPIDSITDNDPDDPDLPKQKASYQSICGLINWIAIWTRPNTATVLSFLDYYQGAPNNGHY